MFIVNFPVAPDYQSQCPSSECRYQVWTPHVHDPGVYVRLDEAGGMIVHEGYSKQWSMKIQILKPCPTEDKPVPTAASA